MEKKKNYFIGNTYLNLLEHNNEEVYDTEKIRGTPILKVKFLKN